jgi:beta-aspartyl-dipeptidase (metallo-type)
MALATLVRNGELFTPAPLGQMDLLCLGDRILARGHGLSHRALAELGVECLELDAGDCVVVPGLIDPHEHLIGGSGESGFASRTPEISASELIEGGIATVVGCLGTDTYTRNMPALLGHARALAEEGFAVYLWTGGYPVPPATLTGNLQQDLILIPEIIGAGEVAIADRRGSMAQTRELARLVADAAIGGSLTGKCGVTHFHLGDHRCRFRQLEELLTEYEVDPELLYPTHAGRSPELLVAAAGLTKRGITVDIDVYDRNLCELLERFSAAGGDLSRVTLSTDAGAVAPATLLEELRKVHFELRWPLEKLLPLATTQTAKKLGLPQKGELNTDASADVLVLWKKDLRIRHFIVGGKVLVEEGALKWQSRALQNSNRRK